MKNVFLVLFLSICTSTAIGQMKTRRPATGSEPLRVVEASCGECKFGMKGKSCDLAVRIKGKSYFVDGTKIDDHGDAHAKDGFCEKIRKAEVKGTIVNNRFVASYFKLLPDEKNKN